MSMAINVNRYVKKNVGYEDIKQVQVIGLWL